MLESKAEKGDVSAMLDLAKIYRSGNGVPSSPTKAYRYYSMAARQNAPEALFFIAECQDVGRNVPADPNAAFQNYLRAAKAGLADAAYAVGHFYEVGRGTFRDVSKAREFYQLAASKGHSDAKNALAKLSNGGAREPSSLSPLERAKGLAARETGEDLRKIHLLRKIISEKAQICSDIAVLERAAKILM